MMVKNVKVGFRVLFYESENPTFGIKRGKVFDTYKEAEENLFDNIGTKKELKFGKIEKLYYLEDE